MDKGEGRGSRRERSSLDYSKKRKKKIMLEEKETKNERLQPLLK